MNAQFIPERGSADVATLRIPPHDANAEQAVLGMLMLVPESLAKVSDWLKEADFYRKDHRLIYRAITGLIGRGAPVDPVTLGDWFDANGLAEWVNPAYLIELTDSTASAANVVAHAEIVVEKSRLRSVIDTSTKLTEAAYSRGSDSQQIIATAAHDLAQMQASKLRGGLEPAKVGMRRMQSELMERYKRGPALLGQPWPWKGLNDCTKGLRDGVLYVVGARPSMGKALALDTPIPTPSGWSTMGALRVGDFVFGMDGKPVEITNATDEMTGRRCYEVEFSDGSVIVADEDHQWLTSTRSARRAATPPKGYEFRRNSPYSRDQRSVSEVTSIKTTGQILGTIRDGCDRLNHTVQMPAPLQLPNIELPIDPYILGYWLGDGSSYHANISVGEHDCDALAAKIEAAGYFYHKSRDVTAWRFSVSTQPIRKGGHYVGIDSLMTRLRAAGLIKNKHIPVTYLRAGDSQRRALLAGLLDSDGTVDRKTGRVCFAVTSKRLATDFRELATTLGYRPNLTEKNVRGRSPSTSICYMVGFMAHDVPVTLTRKAALLKSAHARSKHRTIVAVRPIDSVPVRCIEVGNTDHMYLAGRSMIPTHNSIFGLQTAVFSALRGSNTAFFSVEMGADECMGRAVACVGEIPHDWVESPNDKDMDAEFYWGRLTDATQRIIESPLLIDETPAIAINQLMARARRAHMQKPLRLIVVDHMHDMAIDPKQARFEYGLIAQGGKTLAKELHCPVILLAQLNRSSAVAGKRPTMTDLRESGEIEQKADVILFLHREDYHDKNTHLKGVVEVIPSKGRNIRTGETIYLQNTFSEMRMQDWIGEIPAAPDAENKKTGRGYK